MPETSFRLFTAVVALSVPMTAQFSLDAELATPIVSRAIVAGVVVEEVAPAGPVGPELFNTNVEALNDDGRAYTNTTITTEGSDTAWTATLAMFTSTTAPFGVLTVEPFDLVLTFQAPTSSVVRVSASAEFTETREPDANPALPNPPARIALDARNDGLVDEPDLVQADWSSAYANPTGTIQVRLIGSLGSIPRPESIGSTIVTVRFETDDGCEVDRFYPACRAGGPRFVTERLLDGRLRSRLLNPGFPSPVDRVALVLGFASQPIPIPASLSVGFTDCAFVPRPDVVLSFAPDGTFVFPPIAGLAPIELFLQSVELDPIVVQGTPNVTLRVSDAFRVACF